MIIEALEIVLNLAKAEYQNSVDLCGSSVEQHHDMEEAIAVVERLIDTLKAGWAKR